MTSGEKRAPSGPMGRRWSKLRRGCAGLLLGSLLGGCAGVVQYTDELPDPQTGRSQLVTTPATLGGIVGFVVGVPASVAALPITYSVHRVEQARAPLRADLLSTLLFPSFVFWRAGTLLLGAPFDALEFLSWRLWTDDLEPTDADREAFERELDRDELPSYPVEPVYPPPSGDDADWELPPRSRLLG